MQNPGALRVHFSTVIFVIQEEMSSITIYCRRVIRIEAVNTAMERADIIAALRCCGNTDTKRPDCEHCPLNGHMCVKRMLEGAADLLEREPPNDPLTLEALRGMDGDKIHIQFIGTCKGFYDDEAAPYYGNYEQYIQKYNGMLRACDLPLKYYGKTWLAYR